MRTRTRIRTSTRATGATNVGITSSCDRASRSSSALHLVPLSSFTDPSHKTFLSTSDSYRLCIDSSGNLRQDQRQTTNDDNRDSNSDRDEYYTISIAEEDDLPQIATFVIDAFGGADVITLSSEFQSSLQSPSNANPLEKAIVLPGIELWNNYANAVAFTDVLSGLRQRIKFRKKSESDDDSSNNDSLDYIIEAPPSLVRVDNESGSDTFEGDIDEIAAKSSVIFVLARSSNDNDTKDIDIIASVELRLQPTDAKIPFSQPWFDKIERTLAQKFPFQGGSRSSSQGNNDDDNGNKNEINTNTKILQPYLSNLCVDNSVRGRGLGKVLCRIIECTVKDSWKFQKIYLHVDLDNLPALNLYKGEGYSDVGTRWNPFWAGSASEIGYFVKKL